MNLELAKKIYRKYRTVLPVQKRPRVWHTAKALLEREGERISAKKGFPEHEPEMDFIPSVFTLQDHWWSTKHHWDVRVLKRGAHSWFGFMLFSDPRKVTTSRHAKGGVKGLSSWVAGREKKTKPKRTMMERLDEMKWMTFEGKIPVGAPGNPTKNFTAYMDILEKKQPAVLHRRAYDNILITFLGKRLHGTYLLRLYKTKEKDLAWTFVRLSKDKQFRSSIMRDIATGRKKIPIVKSWKEAKERGLLE